PGTCRAPSSLFPLAHTRTKQEKRAACACRRPKSREETPKEGGGSLRCRRPLTMRAVRKFKIAAPTRPAGEAHRLVSGKRCHFRRLTGVPEPRARAQVRATAL